MSTVNNFVNSEHESNQLKVCSNKSTSQKMSLVSIICLAGSIRFQHSMTPTQARELAGYLQAEANYCEQQDKTETTDWSES